MKCIKNRGKWIPRHKGNNQKEERHLFNFKGGKETMLCSEDRFLTLIVAV